ncbi:hypothetical protein [Candidatus Blastococcus massiliensis]|uniref:hypothetical protein n=1 Tax=Candidatus Blastococcus massiliensis TaxID=1470358 RepID=UPI0004BB87D5|nr:hypothetical protein [Candidatus Blastococcus massiliensis]
MSTSTVRRPNTGRIVGSIAVIGAAAAVAGLGTFGGFTDSTASVDAVADTGVVSIDVSAAGTSAPVPYTAAGMMQGDVGSMPLDLRNDGTVDLSSLVFGSRATTSSLLDTDVVHGLQLKLETCATPWARSGYTYSCTGGATALYEGPMVANQALTGARSLQAGAVDRLLATVSFPDTGSNALQNQSSTFEFVFTGTQRDGAAR